MKITAKLTNLGIDICLDKDAEEKALEPATDADQEKPRRKYVYAHLDSAGRVFYVGKGAGKRAWSTDRHPLWCRYVEKHLNGNYRVQILQDNLSAEDAEELEAAWIAQCSDTLVNWANMGRAMDLEALERYHKLRDANRSLIQEAKAVEKCDLAKAVAMYIQAIEATRAYASISYETGLVGQLLEEEAAEIGRNGEIAALDRLSICLIRLGKVTEAARRADSYFALYRRDLQFGAAKRIAKRIKKALAREEQEIAPTESAKPNHPPNRPKAAGR